LLGRKTNCCRQPKVSPHAFPPNDGWLSVLGQGVEGSRVDLGDHKASVGL
jgi:hypothetical protein